MSGDILGMKEPRVPGLALRTPEYEPGEEASREGYAEVYADALGDLADAHVHRAAREAEEGRHESHEDPRVDRVEEDLEDRVEGHEARAVFRIAARASSFQTITMAMQRARPIIIRPDHVLWLVPQENDGEGSHEDRADDPVLDEGQAEDLAVLEDILHLVVAHLRQRRVHHEYEADRYRDIGRPDGEPVPERRDAGDEGSRQDADPPSRGISIE